MFSKHCNAETNGNNTNTDSSACDKLTYAVYNSDPNDLPGFWTLLISTFMPLYGFTLWYIWKKDKPKSSNAIVLWSCICLILYTIIGISLMILDKTFGIIS